MENNKDLYSLFKQKLEQVSGECCRVQTILEVSELINKILKSKGAKNVAIDPQTPGSNAIFELLHKNGFNVYSENFNNTAARVDAGITKIKWAVAELGTLIQDGTDINQRLCSTLPPIHIAIVPSAALIPTLSEALTIIHRMQQIPGFLGFITGPSRTSDIERVLTIGVHGPEQLIVIFVDEPGEVI